MKKSLPRTGLVFLLLLAVLVVATAATANPMETADSRIFLPLVKKPFKFSPIPDGYSFQNYGNKGRTSDIDLDLGTADLINMFGAAKVCNPGSTPCVLTGPAETWRKKQLEGMGGGHCEGMAVTSLRFLYRQPFYNGKKFTSDFQDGKEKVYDLALDQSIGNYIAYYFVLQSLAEVYNPTEAIRVANTPRQILELVRRALEEGADPYEFGIYKYDTHTGKLSAGHAIVPYAIEDKGGGFQALTAYDNNFPGEARTILFNTNHDSWTYNTAANPADPPELYEGNAGTHSLDLSRLSWRNREPFTCPFGTAATHVEFFLTHGGDLLITNAAGQRLGYDGESDRMVNEVPGAQVVYVKGGQGPRYRLPVQGADQWYRVVVSGQSAKDKEATDLVMVGPGFVVGFESLQLQPNQRFQMSLSSDGQQLIYEPGQTGPVPKVFKSTL